MPAIMHSYADRKDDFYPTPIEAVRAFMRVEGEHLPRNLWEPACGDGAIVSPLRLAGYSVYATDLVERGCPDSHSGIDFLLPVVIPDGVDGIVTNPPFKLMNAFVERACSLSPYVAMLARLAFLEGNQRRGLFERMPPARVHVSSRRLPMMHRDGWDGPISTSTTCFAWFVWDRRWRGEPVIRWFDWRDDGT
jgi:hypothetical protein